MMMGRKHRKAGKRLLSDQRGVAAMEFALIAPTMFVMLMGLMEYGYVSFARSSLEHATIGAARSAVAGNCSATRESKMLNFIARSMKPYIAYNNEPTRIEYKSYSDKFGEVGNPEPFTDANHDGFYTKGETFQDVNGNGKWDSDMGRVGSVGGVGEVVTYATSYRVQSLFPAIRRSFNHGQPYYELRASTVVRNEPVFKEDCSGG